jgi:hypothetical protein
MVVAILNMSLLLLLPHLTRAAAAAAAAGSRRAAELVCSVQRQLARRCFASGAC